MRKGRARSRSSAGVTLPEAQSSRDGAIAAAATSSVRHAPPGRGRPAVWSPSAMRRPRLTLSRWLRCGVSKPRASAGPRPWLWDGPVGSRAMSRPPESDGCVSAPKRYPHIILSQHFDATVKTRVRWGPSPLDRDPTNGRIFYVRFQLFALYSRRSSAWELKHTFTSAGRFSPLGPASIRHHSPNANPKSFAT